jgi:hypothetical protein
MHQCWCHSDGSAGAPSRFPGASRDLLLPQAPAFAGEAGVARYPLLKRVSESEHWRQGTVLNDERNYYYCCFIIAREFSLAI